MKWTITDANIALTYTCITWERECGGVKQTLTIMVWNHNEMTLYASSVWEGDTRAYELRDIPREYIHSGEDVTNYFNKAMFKGEKA